MSRGHADAVAEREYEHFAERRRAQREAEAEADVIQRVEADVKELARVKKPESSG